MVKKYDDEVRCPLFDRVICYPECYEVQEIRGDEMDMKWARETFSVEKANEVCERCRWFVVDKSE